MTTRYLQYITITGTLALTTGCSALFGPEGYFRDRGDDYLQADVLAPMQVPADIPHKPIEPLYYIPSEGQVDITVNDEFEVPRPQPLSSNAFTDKVKIQRLLDRRWILVHSEPADVWSKVRYFLSRNQLQVVFTDPNNGIIETGWLKFKGDSATKDKYRLSIEPGVQPGHSEIHVLHMSVSSDVPGRGQVNWPKTSVDPEREAWMVDELAASLAADTSGESSSLLAQNLGVNDRVRLTRSGKEPVIALDLEYARAWATVGYALQQEGFQLWGEDSSTRVFYIDYQAPEPEDEEPGFFSRLFHSGPKEPAKSPYTIKEVLEHLQVDDTPANRALFVNVPTERLSELRNVPGYLVIVRGEDQQVEVHVRDPYGNPLDNKQTKLLLDAIRSNLI